MQEMADPGPCSKQLMEFGLLIRGLVLGQLVNEIVHDTRYLEDAKYRFRAAYGAP